MKSQVSQSGGKQTRVYNFVQFVVINTKGMAIESMSREDEAHTMIGLSFISVKSAGECCCRMCPEPGGNEIASGILFFFY